MNKKELIKAISERTDITQKEVDIVLSEFQDVVKEELAKGEKVQLVGFGTFEVTERGERMGRNPKTGEEMLIKSSKSPKFKAGKALKDAVNV